MSEHDSTRPHSSEYFGEERNFFWNADFLDLMAARLALGRVRRAADLGCGVGHWSALLLPRLAPGASLVGIDREPRHVADYLARLQGGGRVEALTADARHLPLPDGAFDLATCQTLLLHLPDPEAALAEMIRITAPGGLVLCAEPNNLVARLPFGGAMVEEPPDRLVRRSEFAWRQVLGRARRGKGAEYVGELLPGLFARLGLEDVKVWLSDKAHPHIPPFSSPAEIAMAAAWERWRTEGVGPYERAEIRDNVLAGGGSESFFEAAWRDFVGEDAPGDASAAGGVLLYLIAGRRPGRRRSGASSAPERRANSAPLH
ncbi:class I SAM-dependent methyltransferase [Methylosinus sp. Sm6]|uniref:class I SAM-dependent methyltransferase n=1 Tax=Methylosinus sp. Sm6 TaxID=2866948 RepID=UPI001C9996B3|nr:methyltransferase domain-containing protein [Methylosinus sp. Sm6]MBY6240254.1 methyltransferase domain-containing protein [Methylosinus sp. Sm6]